MFGFWVGPKRHGNLYGIDTLFGAVPQSRIQAVGFGKWSMYFDVFEK